ncbi:SET domain-containing protein [Roseiarcus fermentans]|uniref:SET domain-containing protein n=1 Tax=Roseiarcus fermentans TaxID=1473586 RepID=UPI001475C1F2|nr:SET domain-containing protein-lysine N-methyltransferase [Roseiarcus fermentans]
MFADRPFARGDYLLTWGGCVVTTAKIRNRLGLRYALQVEDDLHIATPLGEESLADFVNHSCDPNAVLAGQITLIAWRDIAAGEEICFDYATSESTVQEFSACLCGSPECRGAFTADDWRLPRLRRRYGQHFSPYLRRRIAAEADANASPCLAVGA